MSAALLGFLGSLSVDDVVNACPFASNDGNGEMPAGHPDVDGTAPRLRGLASLRNNPAAAEQMARLLQQRQEERSLITGGCFTNQVYSDIVDDIEIIFEGMENVTDSRERGHFFGGIVRLAAHDFMDYHDSPPDVEESLGADGCIDWNTGAGQSGADNAGLDTIWCDDYNVCPLKGLYDTVYGPGGTAGTSIGRADFWVVAANAVIKLSSVDWIDPLGNPQTHLDLPFRYGRVDRDDCTGISAHRLPGASGCDEVEKTFITQMNLTGGWRDAVALLGAHTLGYGHSQFSGHDGMWVDEVEETVKFDKRYYEEILVRAWRLRDPDNNLAQDDLSVHIGQPRQDWTWAGNNGGNPRFMLNADICLAFDIDVVTDCCARIRQGGAVLGEVFCVDPRIPRTDEEEAALNGTIAECESSALVRPIARAAVEEFAANDPTPTRPLRIVEDDNDAFYAAFSEAWQRATESGSPEGSLRALSNTCNATPQPTPAPSETPTAEPTPSPTEAPTPAPTGSPSTPRPTAECEDTRNTFLDNNDRERTCDWVVTETRNRCQNFAHLCPVTCDECDCLLENRVCETGDDCCSGICDGDNTCGCKTNQEICSSSVECCSGECHGDGFCGCIPGGENCNTDDECCGQRICGTGGTCTGSGGGGRI